MRSATAKITYSLIFVPSLLTELTIRYVVPCIIHSFALRFTFTSRITFFRFRFPSYLLTCGGVMDITAGRGDDGGEAATRGGAGDKGGGQGGRGNEDARAGAATGDQGGGVNNNKGVRMEAEFDEVITHLTTYLHILSSGSSDTDRDLKDQGK